MPHREQRELEAIPHVTLLVHRRQNVLDRLLGQTKLTRQLAIGSPGDNSADEIALPRRQFQKRRPARQSTAPIQFDGRVSLISGAGESE